MERREFSKEIRITESMKKGKAVRSRRKKKGKGKHVADRWVPHVGDSEEKRGGGWVRDAAARELGRLAAAGLGPCGRRRALE
jgi:hypothetical protein